MEGKFFYAVILIREGIDTERVVVLGLNEKRVYPVIYRDIAALVSDYPMVDTIRLLRRNLAPYHGVCRKFGENFTTLPARFGQVAKDEEQVRRVLEENYGMILGELEKLDGKVEMGVKMWWDVEDVFEYFLEKDEQVKSYRNRLLRGPGQPDRMQRMEFGKFFYERMMRERERITGKILFSLETKEARVEDPRDDNTVMNASFLVREERINEFEMEVEETAHQLGPEYRVQINGPWLPFSFVDRLELQFEE